MKALVGQRWNGGLLDYHGGTHDCVIDVSAWLCVAPVEDLYFIRRPDWGMVWNYMREIGPVHVIRKIRSRSSERRRNQKFVSCGVGVAVGGGSDHGYQKGDRVMFIAPCHPRCVDRVVVPRRLVKPCPADFFSPPEDAVAFLEGLGQPGDAIANLSGLCGASSIDATSCESALLAARAALQAAPWSGASLLPRDTVHVDVRRAESPIRRGSRPRAVLFGYGNYAKTIILPNVEPHLSVERIHEIDPLQIGDGAARYAWSTAPSLEGTERFDVHLISTYHHTHAPLAAIALRDGAYVLVEKPLAVSRGDLALLATALGESRRLFACYQKRYLQWNEIARADLGVRSGDPINYHCIVYEVPLPARHWYRWPVSGGRIISNGCHWIDHFLFLNDFAPVESVTADEGADGTAFVTIRLLNGAAFSMVLTDVGSERLGVQDHVELRAGSTTVRISNGGVYTAENSRRVLRRLRCNRLSVYSHMYSTIAEAISRNASGDTPHSVLTSAETVLAASEALDASRRRRAATARIPCVEASTSLRSTPEAPARSCEAS